MTLFIAGGYVLGASSFYLLKKGQEANFQEGISTTFEGLLPDIAFIFTDATASSISSASHFLSRWFNMLVNFLGLWVVQATTTAMLEKKYRYSQLETIITTGMSVALYIIAAAFSENSRLQPHVVLTSTAIAPALITILSRFLSKDKKEYEAQPQTAGTTASAV